MGYAVRNRKGDNYFNPNSSIREYEEHREMVLDQNSRYYGAVLVETHWRRYAWNLKLRIFFRRDFFKWVPQWPTRWNTAISWLWFQLRWEGEYRDEPGKVVRDHIADASKFA